MLSAFLVDQPLVIFLDDVQWGETFTIELLKHFILGCPERLMLVIAYRYAGNTPPPTAASSPSAPGIVFSPTLSTTPPSYPSPTLSPVMPRILDLEEDPAIPPIVTKIRNEAESANVSVETLNVIPLRDDAVAQLIGMILQLGKPEEFHELAVLINKRSKGNPLIVRQQLRELIREGMITRN